MRDEADERNMGPNRLTHAVRSAQVVVPCSDLAAAMDFFINRLGFRVDAIFPADAPSTAVISGHGVTLRLEQAGGDIPAPTLRFLVDRSALPAVRELEAPGGIKIELIEANPPIVGGATLVTPVDLGFGAKIDSNCPDKTVQVSES
jgi:hypothetical protein